MMRVNLTDLGCDAYSSSPHKWLQAPKGTGYMYMRDDVMDRIWNTIVTEGWEEPQLKAERFQRIGSSNVPTLWGLKAAIEFASAIGIDKIEARHRELCDYILGEMMKRGAESWTSPDPALRCAIATVNVPPIVRKDFETWIWQKHKIRIRGGEPSRLRLSTPYYLLTKDIDQFLAAFDQYKRGKLT
jgi:isopenicillin-N epimerase